MSTQVSSRIQMKARRKHAWLGVMLCRVILGQTGVVAPVRHAQGKRMDSVGFAQFMCLGMLFVLVACQTPSTSIAPSLAPLTATAVTAPSVSTTSVAVVPTSAPAPATVAAPTNGAASPLHSTPQPVEHTIPTSMAQPGGIVSGPIAEWKVNMPADLAFAFDSVWVPSLRDPNTTTRIDPVSNKIIAVVKRTGYHAHEALMVGDSLWVTGELSDLSRVNPKTNKVVAQVPGAHTYIAYGFSSLWSTTTTNKLDRIDPTMNKIVASIPLGSGAVDCNNDVLVTTAAVWVDHCDEGALIKVDPATNTIVSKTPYEKLVIDAKAQTTVPAGKGTAFIWRALPTGLLRIDPSSGAGLTFLPLAPEQVGAGWVQVTDDAVWLSGIGQIERVNVRTNLVDATFKVHAGETKVGIGFGSVWVAYEQSGLVQRLDVAP